MASLPAAQLIPSATILLVRDGAQGLEVFMVVRHHQIDFASGALVFPGGKVDKRDFDANIRGLTDGADGCDERELSMRVAAIREAYEECGVFLARPDGAAELIDAARLTALEPWREKLNKGETGILEILQAENLRLAADLLIRFAHWITPVMMPKRFDTLFYLAPAPVDHLAVHDGSESVDSVWIRPADALAESLAGSKTIIFPTRLNVARLGHSATVAAAIAAAAATPVVTVEPRVEKRADGSFLVIPADAGYDITEESLENVTGPRREQPGNTG